MGYTFHEGQVEEHNETLRQIAVAVEEGIELTFACDTFAQASSLTLKMHNLLKAAQILKDECAGRYVHLREAVSVSPDYKSGQPGVRIKPKKLNKKVTALAVMKPITTVPSEHDVIRDVLRRRPKREEINYLPSGDGDEARLFGSLFEAGYALARNDNGKGFKRTEHDNNTVTYEIYIREDYEPNTGVNILDRYTKDREDKSSEVDTGHV